MTCRATQPYLRIIFLGIGSKGLDNRAIVC